MSNKTMVMNISDTWLSVNTFLGVGVGEQITIHNDGVNWAMLLIGDEPSPLLDNGVLLTGADKDSYQLTVPIGSGEVWIKSASSTYAVVVVQAGTPISQSLGGIPLTVLQGLNAITTQPYSEANRKNGVQFTASRKLTVSNGQIINSIIKTGDKPIDLKSRTFSYSGLGLNADIYQGATYTGGTQDPVYSGNGITTSNFDFQLLVGFTLVTDGTKFAATEHFFGQSNPSSKGEGIVNIGSNYILAPNTTYLLRITSLDAQDISARIEGYNGFLDLPFTTY